MRNLCYSVLLLLLAGGAKAQTDLSWTSKVGAKHYPTQTKTYWANQNGAVGDSATLNTQAIQRTIDRCAAQGGGVVTFKPGRYRTGSLFIKSNVVLLLGDKVELLGSQDIKDYPIIDTRVAGIEMKWPAALINIIGQHNAAVAGKGLVNAQGKPFWDMYWNMRKQYDPKGLRWIVDYDAQRPRTLLVSRSNDITIKGITLQQAGFWTVQLLYSTQVTVDGITIHNNVGGHGPSTDGVDIDSSTYILVQNCDIDCNDDNFCLKAGRDWDGLRVNKPTEYVVVRKCISRKGAGLITLGSETSGGIRHILATDLVGNGTSNGLNLKSASTRGGTIEDIHFQNVVMNGVGTALQINMNWNPAYSYSKLPEGYDPKNIPEHWQKMLNHPEPAQKGIPHFKDVYISNVKATGAKKAVNVMGMEQSEILNFHLKNITIDAATAGNIQFAQNWTWQQVNISTQDNTALKLPASFKTGK